MLLFNHRKIVFAFLCPVSSMAVAVLSSCICCEEEVLGEGEAFRATSKAQMPKNTGTGSWFKLLQTAGSSLYTQQGQGTRLCGHLQLDYPKLSIVGHCSVMRLAKSKQRNITL